MNTIELGDRVRDTVTGFIGVAVGKTQWLHGCNRFMVQPIVKKDGTLGDSVSFDEPQLVIVQKKKVPKGNGGTGGFDLKISPKASPTRR